MLDEIRRYVRQVIVPVAATAMVFAAMLTAFLAGNVSADSSTCYTRDAYTPYITDPPGLGNAELHGTVYLECSTYENRTVSSYLMEDLFLASDAQIQKYTYADYDWWHQRTAHYGYLGYNDDGDTQEYYTRLRFYDPANGYNSGDYDSGRNATHYTWRP